MVHRYFARCAWSGSTAVGYEHYDRTHTVVAPPAAAALTLTTGDAERGNPAQLNPEQLVLAAASSCQLLWFLHLAARARIDVLEYVDEAEAEMPEHERPVRISAITLRPRIVVGPRTSEERVRKLVRSAHRECYIANSLRSEVVIEPLIEVRDGAPSGSEG